MSSTKVRSYIDVLLLDTLSEQRVHPLAQPDDVHFSMHAALDGFLQVDEQIGIRRLGSDVESKSIDRRRRLQISHRVDGRAFTQARCLPFAPVVTLLLRKGVNSVQSLPNEALARLGEAPATAAAFSQARDTLEHTASVAPDAKAVVGRIDGDSEHRTFRDLRVPAVEGSKILLPDSADVRRTFGTVADCNARGSNAGERPDAVASVLDDVLERVAFDATLGTADADASDLKAVYALAAIAAGATTLSHVNDAGFWLLRRVFGMNVKTTLKTSTVMETTLGPAIFVVALLLWFVVP
jgi:hypothetical protein